MRKGRAFDEENVGKKTNKNIKGKQNEHYKT